MANSWCYYLLCYDVSILHHGIASGYQILTLGIKPVEINVYNMPEAPSTLLLLLHQ